MEGQARSALLVARSARNQQVSPSKILFWIIASCQSREIGKRVLGGLYSYGRSFRSPPIPTQTRPATGSRFRKGWRPTSCERGNFRQPGGRRPALRGRKPGWGQTGGEWYVEATGYARV